MSRQRLPRGNCLNCGQLLDRRFKVYRTLHCQMDYAYHRYIEAWLAGLATGVNSWGIPVQSVRRYLFEKFHGCVTCGWAERNPTTGKVPLHLDHIDGDWRNNRPENLRLLCPNHHALTASYGSLNRGRGRPYHVIKGSPAP